MSSPTHPTASCGESHRGAKSPPLPWERVGERVMFRFICVALAIGFVAPAFAQEPAKSIFLVARKDLPDPNFRDAVVLVLQRGQSGPVGVIINKPTNVVLSRVLTDIDALRASQEPIFFGGPVSRSQLNFVFRASSPPEDAIEVLDGIYMSSSRELLRELAGRDNAF